jgi:outer membrane lipoprotein
MMVKDTMSALRQIALLVFASLLLSACATTPKFDTSGIDMSITPQRAAAESESLRDSTLLWGGVIIAAHNLKEETQLEILGYPLDSDQRPEMETRPLGRFIAVQTGYLETSDYTEGRLVTVSGTLDKNLVGRIGESEYTYPVLKINKLYLWPRRGETPQTQFHLGIGVMFHN